MNREARAASHFQRLFETGSLSGLTEAQLLERFVRHGDQSAFELLVVRHGPMVLGLCRRILDDANDVDDAFQATFLVLIRRAPSLGPGDVLAAWLHGVALKVARRARLRREQHTRRERTGVALEASAPALREGVHELRAVLDEEIDRLPWKYRAPVALFYLEGLTHEETARQLGWPLGTVKGRLARARSLLGSRLSRRGIASAAGAFAGSLVFESSLQAAPSESLIAAALRASVRIADGRIWDAVVSTSIAELVRGAFATMMFSKLKLAAAFFVITGLTVTGAGVLARQQGEAGRPDAEEPPPAVRAEAQPAEADEPDSTEPEAAETAARREAAEALHEQLLEAAAKMFKTTFDEYREKPIQPDRVYRASRLLLDAKLAAASNQSDQAAAYQAHLDRIDALGRVEVHQKDRNIKPESIADEVQAYRAEARLMLARSHSEIEPSHSVPEEEADNDPDVDAEGEVGPKSKAILAKLEAPIAMNFPHEQPLEDVLKYIKQATQDSGGQGITIYVDPVGLSEAEKTMASPISLELEGVPLRRTLQLLLKQLNLAYFVDDGILVITSEDSVHERASLPPSVAKLSPLLEKQEKARRGELDMSEMDSLIEQIKKLNEMEDLLKVDEPGHRGAAEVNAPVMTAEQAKALIDQMKELTGALKAAHDRPRGGGFQ